MATRRVGPSWVWILVVAAFCALAVASCFLWDARVVEWVHTNGIDRAAKDHWWWVRKKWGRPIWPGHFFCTMLIALLIMISHHTGLRGACLLLLAGVFSAANSIIKWGVGRSRPDWKTGTPSFTLYPFKGGLKGLVSQENLSFPSGDVALAVSSAAVLSYLMPRWWPVWWVMAGVVGFQRVAENAHHLSDVLAAAALGVLAFHCARVACRVLPGKAPEPRGFPVISPGAD